MANLKRQSKDMSDNENVKRNLLDERITPIYDRRSISNITANLKGNPKDMSNNVNIKRNLLDKAKIATYDKKSGTKKVFRKKSMKNKEVLLDNSKDATLENRFLANDLLQDMSKSLETLAGHVKDKHATIQQISKQQDEKFQQNIEEEFEEILSPKKEGEESVADEYEIEDFAKLEDAPKLNISTKFEQYLGSNDTQDKNLSLGELKSKYIDKESELFRKYEDTKDTISEKERLDLEEQLDRNRDILSKLIPLEVVDNYNDDWEDIASGLSSYISKAQFETLKQPIYINTQTGEKVNLSDIDLKELQQKRSLEVKRYVEQSIGFTTEKVHIRNYEEKEEIVELAKRLEDTIRMNITKEDNIITETLEQELKNAYNKGMSQGNIDEALDYALDNIRVDIQVNGIKINTSLAKDPQNIQFSNGDGVTLVNTKVDKIELNNENDKILFENRAKLLRCVGRAHQNEQKLSMCIKNYETILNTDVKHREEVYKELFDGNNLSDSIKKEAINIVIKRQLEKNNNTLPKNNGNMQKETVAKKSIWRRLVNRLGSILGITKKKDTTIEVNLLREVSDNTKNHTPILRKVQDLKGMTQVVDALNDYYLQGKDVRNVDVVYKGETVDKEEIYKIQVVTQNGNKTILDAKTKDGQIYIKRAQIQQEFKNVEPIKIYNLADRDSVGDDLMKVINSLETMAVKMEISNDKTEISKFKALQSELFINGRFNDVNGKKITSFGINLKQDMMNDIGNYEVLLLKGYEKIITRDLETTLADVSKKSKLELKEGYPEKKHEHMGLHKEPEKKLDNIKAELGFSDEHMELHKEPKKKLDNIKAELGFSDNDISNFITTQKYLEIMPVSEQRENERRNSISSVNKNQAKAKEYDNH